MFIILFFNSKMMKCEGDACEKDKKREKEDDNRSSWWWFLVIGGTIVLLLLVVVVISFWSSRQSPQPSPSDLASIKSWLQRVPNVSNEVIRNQLIDKEGFSKDLIECIVRDRLSCPQLYTGYRGDANEMASFQFSGDVSSIPVQMVEGACASEKYKQQLNAMYNECFRSSACENNPTEFIAQLTKKYKVPGCAVQDLKEKTSAIYQNWHYGHTGDVGALSSTLQSYQIPQSVVACVLKKGKRCAL